MYRSSTIIRELALNLAKVTFMLCGSMLPYNLIINNDVISPNVLI